jgi:hypothetical protein
MRLRGCKPLKVLIATLAVLAVSLGTQAGGSDPQGRHMVARNWWESAAAIVRVSINPGTESRQGKRPQFPIDLAKAGPILDEYKARGVSAIEIFAPYYGGRSYGGLDAIDRFNLNPKVGTMEDFRALVRLIHSKGMAVISFDNLGYCSSEAPEFLKAADDVRAGRDTAEARRFLWADSADAPPPEPDNDKVFMVRPRHLPKNYDPVKSEFWEYSERARKYYWTKWLGPDLSGKVVRLPQYNWRSVEFQQYAERVVRFWMDTGLDGMIIDAVNWYVGHTWEQDRRRITDVIRSYGNVYLQPEGGGAFYEDPLSWIQDGGWNSVQDYNLFIWWEKRNVIRTALDTGDPRPIEQSLRDYHDRVVAVGGVLYFYFPPIPDPPKDKLAQAMLVSVGDLLASNPPSGPRDEHWSRLLKMKAAHRAFHNDSSRRSIPTSADDKYYAFLRTARNNSERVLVVMNFNSAPQTVGVDLSGVAGKAFLDLSSGERTTRHNPLQVELPAYGYRFYRVEY